MKLSVSLTGVMKHTRLGRDFEIEMDDHAAVTDLLTMLDYPSEHHRFITSFINDEQVDNDHALSDGDTVRLYLPVGGG